MLSVTYIYREFRKTNYSIEGIFEAVKNALKDDIEIKDVYIDPLRSRLQNILDIKKKTSGINHITGDVNFLAIGLKGRKNVLTIHDFGYYENPVHSKITKTIYHYLWFFFPLKNIDIVTVVSEFTKQKLIKYFNFPADRIRVIYNPVKPVFRKNEKFELNKVPVILQLGSGDHKNVPNLIEAVKDTGYHIDIVGWPSEKEIALLKQYNISYSVSNSLTNEQIFEKYNSCDILFFASLYEGFGMPIIEAQAVGRPVITSNYGAMKEVGEGSAILVNPLDAMAIKQIMHQLVNDKTYYDEVTVRGFANAAKYDVNTIARQYLAVYNELENKRR